MMKHLLSAAGLAVVLAAPGLATEGWYGTAAVGYGVGNDIDGDRVSGQVPVGTAREADVEPQSDWRFLVGGGYKFANNVRLQLDLAQRFNQSGAIADGAFSQAGFQGDSDFDSVALMLSGIYDFENASRFTPYVGLGVGFAKTNFEAQYIFDPPPSEGSIGPSLAQVSEEETGVAAQLLAGVGIALTERLSADIGYRYFNNLSDFDTTATFADAAVVPQDLKIENFNSHDVFLGLRYAFGAPKAAPAPIPAPAPTPAPVAPAPAPRPPVAPVPVPAPVCSDVPFVVYFDWDRSNLTSQAKSTISSAAAQAARCQIVRVAIEGHADRSGSAQYNVGLSSRRAAIVQQELVSLGVPGSLITIEAKGESDPAVATADGVREPLNRRAEVVIGVRR